MRKVKEKLENVIDCAKNIDESGVLLGGLGLVATAASLGAGITSYDYFVNSDPASGIAWGMLGVAAGIAAIASYKKAYEFF